MTDADWTSVLERFEQSLAQILERSPELPGAGPPAEAAPLPDARGQLWAARLDRLDRDAAAAENGLDADQDALRDWIAAAEGVRRRLG